MTFQKVAWCDRARVDLERIADVSKRDLEIFRGGVESGRFCLFSIISEGARLGSVVWSLEHEPDGLNVVVNAAAVEGGARVFEALWDAFTTLARSIGAATVTCWTERPGLARKLERRGARFKYVSQVEI